MSRAFLWFGLCFSALMLFVGFSNLNIAKLPVILFWLFIGAGSAYKLFGKSSQAS